ncbi:acyltransferase [Mycobacterium sp. 94-17]|uniref:acyltransferase family protein n=1 Tax=Mycobacterium sp. 94-17 TaxID=2986147 RepID=UPI002D1E8CC3|nr:acyltransferase [Mycobacterium sp. 94-17]MEB4208072.1 acyltransferase [Mycobacterium sp. 94-17]
MRLGQEFDPRNNALNAWRLTLATGVILCHSWPLTGRHVSFAPAQQLLRDVWVDGFFAISGFLIMSSWFSNPRLRSYFVARSLRILPGLWVCLAVTAFVIAPIAVAIQGGSAVALLTSGAPITYVLKNSAVMLLQFDVGGTPRGTPWPGWDGSLWTLQWEVLCYIAVAGFGIIGLLRRRWLVPSLLALALCASAILPPFGDTVAEQPLAGQQNVHGLTPAQILGVIAARFAVMFLAGALVYQLRDIIPARWSLVVLSIVIVLAASALPNYRLVAAIPLAYAIIVSGALIRNKHLRLRTDLSYGVYIYAWPMQQLLIICGLVVLNPVAFAIVAAIATLPLAALSWFAVEKPAMALKSRLKRKTVAATSESHLGQMVAESPTARTT